MTAFLTDANRQLTSRPADEHFDSFASLQASANASRSNGKQHTIDPLGIIFRPDESCPNGLGASLSDGLPSLRLTYHSARQVAALAGASPSFVFDRLSPRTAALALNEGIRNRSLSATAAIEPLLALVESGTLRAITSAGYHRVWDAELLEEVDRWLLPLGFAPALPTKNTDTQRNNIMGNNKPALFRGDLDSFAMFMVTDAAFPGSPGPAMPQAFEGVHGERPIRRGVMIQNSEVGVRSFGCTSFIFDDLCANFLIWGARAIKKLRLVHRCAAGRSIIHRFREELRRQTPTIQAVELDMLRRAAETAFAPDCTQAVERLVRQFDLSERQASAGLVLCGHTENRGLKAWTHSWVANGFTSLAKQETNADRMVELATLGGDIVAAATPTN